MRGPVIAEPFVPEESFLPAFAEAAYLAGRTIVVADDEPDQVEFIATVFEDAGATVFRAENGDQALALARRERPDLLRSTCTCRVAMWAKCSSCCAGILISRA